MSGQSGRPPSTEAEECCVRETGMASGNCRSRCLDQDRLPEDRRVQDKAAADDQWSQLADLVEPDAGELGVPTELGAGKFGALAKVHC